MSDIHPGDEVSNRFNIRDKTSGDLTTADSLPTGVVYRNGTAEGSVTVTITNVGTGVYTYSFTVPLTWLRGDLVRLEITATVDSNTDTGSPLNFVVGESLGLEATVDDSSVTPTTTVFALDSGAPSTDDVLNGGFVFFLTGANAKLPPVAIDDYDGTSHQVTLKAALPTAPSDSDSLLVIGKAAF